MVFLAAKARLARALSGDKKLLETLTGAVIRDDPAILARMRSAVRELGNDPAALRRSLKATGAIARIPRRIVENDAYAPIRAITNGSDIARVAKATGLSRAEVEAAKRHFMLDEHILVDEGGKLYRGRFKSYPEDGRIWHAAAEGRKLAPDELNHLKRLIRHEYGEGKMLANRTIEETFVRGELEQRLRTFLSKHVDPEQLKNIMKQETRPIMPSRYAHYVAHYSGYPNP